jgi:hypothetical protein
MIHKGITSECVSVCERESVCVCVCVCFCVSVCLCLYILKKENKKNILRELSMVFAVKVMYLRSV